jgi:hypothetical protein
MPYPGVAEMRTYSVSLVSTDPSHAVDVFYKYRGEQLPEEGEIIDVVRFLRGRVIRARVTRANSTSTRRSKPHRSTSAEARAATPPACETGIRSHLAGLYDQRYTGRHSHTLLLLS